MRPNPIQFVALIAFAALAGCGTKTPLNLPPPEKASATTSVTCPHNKIPCGHDVPASILVTANSSPVTGSRS